MPDIGNTQSSSDALKKIFEQTIDDVLDKSSKGVMSDLTKIMGDLNQAGIPLGKTLSSSMSNIKGVGKLMGDLSTKGLPALGKASTALAGPIGMAASGAIALGSSVHKLYMEFTQMRMELATLTLQMGDLSGATKKTNLAYNIATETAIKWGANIDEVKNILSQLISAGINPTEKAFKNTVSTLLHLKTGFQLSDSAMMNSLKLFRQEYRMKENSVMGVAALTDGYEKLNMTANDYLQTVSQMAKGFLDLGISAYTLSNHLKRAADMGFGAARAQAYTNEMVGGPMKSGLGQRAFLAQQMGIGGGNALAGAAMLAYAPMQKLGLGKGETLGGKAIDVGLKELMGITREEFGKLSEVDKYAAAEQISMFTKQFGISERTTMEEFSKMGLEMRKPELDMLGVAKAQLKKAEKNVELLGELRSMPSQLNDILKAMKYTVLGATKEDMKKAYAQTGGGPQKEGEGYYSYGPTGIPVWIPAKKKRYGGSIEPIPHFKSGGEVPIMAHEGEYVMRPEAVQKHGVGFMDNINQGGTGGSGGTNINVSVNIPVLKQVIEEAITRLFRERPQLALMG